MKLYNKDNGMFCDVSIDKCNAAIIENPLYSVINEPNSLVQRIIRNFAAMDDMISIRGDKADLRAEKRKKSIEDQLHNSTYGIAYIDPSEKVTQLNRPVTNNILDITKYYIEELQGQLGLDSSIMNGTANETTLNNYRQRTIKPIATAISEELTKKYISEEAYKKGERILFFDNPFKLISVSDLTNFLDKLINCEVMTPNEARQIFLMLRPKDDARANQLANRNINPTDKIEQTNNTGSSSLEDDRKEKNIKNE